MSGRGKQPILRRLKQECSSFYTTVKFTKEERERIWNSCINNYNAISRRVWGKRTDARTVYLSIRSRIYDIEKFKNNLSGSVETRNKESYLKNIMSDGIFYLCSKHDRCACGHEEYQGKIFVSADWMARSTASTDSTDSTGYTAAIKSYIRNHKCLTIEEAVDSPIYLVTRPNCRHFFRKLDVDEVLHNSANKLLKQYNMISSSVDSYLFSEYRKYFERLKVLVALRSICPCLELEQDIKNTRTLVKKWRTKIKEEG